VLAGVKVRALVKVQIHRDGSTLLKVCVCSYTHFAFSFIFFFLFFPPMQLSRIG